LTDQIEVLTVGHSTLDAESFVALLTRHSVTAVADVRSSPFSKYASQFNKEALRTTLRLHGIDYVFLGRELGARSPDRDCYVDGRVQYSRLASKPSFRDGLTRVLRGAQSQRVALMCTEKDPLDCHRTILVARELVAEGIRVSHILPDCSVETHDAAMLRLLRRLGMPQTDLFCTTEQLVLDALGKQEERIAYVDPELAALSRSVV
jgi:uncharacterized protein (DUF488 family)